MAVDASSAVTVTPDAAAHVRRLGMERPFSAMLEHLSRMTPGLRSITVELDESPYPGDEPKVVLVTHQPLPASPGNDPTDTIWGNWFLTTFPPEVCRHFVRLPIFEDSNGR
jgi:hypothetical protein